MASSNAPTFNENDDWEIYSERLTQYFKANPKIENGIHAAILLTSVSAGVYKTIKNATFPDKPDAKTFEELCTICKKQFSPVLSIFAERNRFYESQQSEHETVTEWITRVKSLAMPCEFGTLLTLALRDKFISGMRKGPVLERMFEFKETATLDQVVDAALIREMTMKEKAAMAECFKLDDHREKKTYQPRQRPSSSSYNRSDTTASCFACARTGHDFRTCRYRQFKCRNCNLTGHIAAACKKGRGQNMHHLEMEYESDQYEEATLLEPRTVLSFGKV